MPSIVELRQQLLAREAAAQNLLKAELTAALSKYEKESGREVEGIALSRSGPSGASVVAEPTFNPNFSLPVQAATHPA